MNLLYREIEGGPGKRRIYSCRISAHRPEILICREGSEKKLTIRQNTAGTRTWEYAGNLDLTPFAV
jgi:hypothetical protein